MKSSQIQDLVQIQHILQIVTQAQVMLSLSQMTGSNRQTVFNATAKDAVSWTANKYRKKGLWNIATSIFLEISFFYSFITAANMKICFQIRTVTVYLYFSHYF